MPERSWKRILNSKQTSIRISLYYGKISFIQKQQVWQETHQLYYTYDPSGNRVGQTAINFGDATKHKITWYVRDAQGNVMAIYTAKLKSDVSVPKFQTVQN